MKFVVFTVMMFSVFGIAEASVDPSIGNEIHVNCTAPGSTGSVVFSIENSVFSNGVENNITLPSSVVVGASCTAVINAINNETCAAGGHDWAVATPSNTVFPRKGGYLQKFVFTCR